MKKNLLVLGLFIACMACNRLPEQAVLVEDFPATYTLQGDSIRNFDDELGIMDILNAGDYFLCPSHGTDYHFAVYQKDSLTNMTRRMVKLKSGF